MFDLIQILRGILYDVADSADLPALLILRFQTDQIEDEIFILGGALVYRQALRIADKMYITRVHGEFKDADTFFPVVNWDLWEEVERQEFPADAKHAYPYTFLTYVRKK